jgi:hypothetical protein
VAKVATTSGKRLTLPRCAQRPLDVPSRTRKSIAIDLRVLALVADESHGKGKPAGALGGAPGSPRRPTSVRTGRGGDVDPEVAPPALRPALLDRLGLTTAADAIRVPMTVATGESSRCLLRRRSL